MQKVLEKKDYKFGFTTKVDSDSFPKGLSKEMVIAISEKRGEPSFILDFRLKAFNTWKKMREPHWGVNYHPIIYDDICYYSAPRFKKKLNSIDEADSELLQTLERLGVPHEGQKKVLNVAVDVVFDSVSLGVSFKEKLKKAGVILCSMGDAVNQYPELIKKYLGSVVPHSDNFFAALNAAVFSDGSFVYVPKGVKCPVELSTYFRLNDRMVGQFERTLIIADEDASLSYLEGCTAPAHDVNQLHAAVVELVALKNSTIKYSTVQNWYSGNSDGVGGIYNFVTKRGLCAGKNSKISWTQVEAGAAISWKYPSCILKGDNSTGEFYSVALTYGKMQADTGTKMIHIGKNTSSTVVSKGICSDESQNCYRGEIKVKRSGKGSRNFTRCDSLIVGRGASAKTFPTINVEGDEIDVAHEASTSRLNEEQLFYLQSKGFSKEAAIELVVKGFCQEVLRELPLEFAAESQKLLALKLEGAYA